MNQAEILPVFPGVEMNLVRKSSPAIANVISNELCMAGKSASFVKHLVLDITGTPFAGRFIAGQSFGVIAPGTDPRGKPHKVRLDSIASPGWGEDGDAKIISTTPKRLIDELRPQHGDDELDDHGLFLGVCSNYLCDLKPGDEVAITGPNGQRFVLPLDRKKHDYLFLATGTGIAPFRGMMMELLQSPGGPCRSRIDLVMGMAYTSDLLYHDFFLALAAEHENFYYHTAISRESGNANGGGFYIDGVIDRDFAHFAPTLATERTLMYVCGIEGMRYGVVRMLARHELGASYFRVGDAITKSDPAQWTDTEIRRHVKAGARSFLEVY